MIDGFRSASVIRKLSVQGQSGHCPDPEKLKRQQVVTQPGRAPERGQVTSLAAQLQSDLTTEPALRALLAARLRFCQRRRVRECRCVRVGPEVQLVSRAQPGSPLAPGQAALIVRGVKTCGSVHSCPMCAAAIMRERAAELTIALDTLHRDRAVFVTFTLRHTRAMALGPLRKLQALAYSEMKAGRAGAELKSKIGYLGDLKSAEQTWGTDFGWHPHLHSVWAFDAPPTGELQPLLSDRWQTCLANAYQRIEHTLSWLMHNTGPIAERRKERGEWYRPGELGSEVQRRFALKMLGRHYVRKGVTLWEAACHFAEDFRTLGGVEAIMPNDDHGVNVKHLEQGDELSTYLSKLGLEVTGIAKKTSSPDHFTSWDIAREAASSGGKFIGLWKEHSNAMKGARQLTWSRGFRALCGLEPERSDEELAGEPLEPDEIENWLGTIHADAWDTRTREDGQELISELYETHATGGDLYAFDEFGERLVEPRSGQRTIEREPVDTAPTIWERWQAEASARQRGTQRVPKPVRAVRVVGAEPRSAQRYQDSLDALREDLWIEQGIG